MSPSIVRAILKSTNSLWFPFPTQLVSHKQWWSKPLQQALHSLQCLVRSGITMGGGGGGGGPKLLFLCSGTESILDEMLYSHYSNTFRKIFVPHLPCMIESYTIKLLFCLTLIIVNLHNNFDHVFVYSYAVYELSKLGFLWKRMTR